jgi:PAS domain S-box-containing protein
MDRGPLIPTASALDESQFRALAETTPDAIVMGDASGCMSYVNPAAERLFARRAQDMVGRPITLLMPARFAPLHDAGFDRFIRTGAGHIVGTTLEVVAARSDGHEFPIELSLGATGTGESRTVTAVIRDITDRRRAERHLAAQLAVTGVLAGPHTAAETVPRIVEELTRALAWDVGLLWLHADGVLAVRHDWQADPERTRDFVRASRAIRLEPGRGLPGAALQAGGPVWLDDLGSAMGLIPERVAALGGLRGGIALPLLTEGRAIGVIECFTHENTPVDRDLRDLLMTVASQVTEHVQRLEAEEHLEEARTRLRNAFEHAPIGMALVAPDGRWISANPALCRITGYTEDELLGLTFADITHPEDLDADTALAARVLAGELDSYELDKRYVRRTGEPVWVRLNVSVVRHAAAPYFIAQIQDITEARRADELRAQAAAELERSNAALEDLAHIAAHDLRTPLQTISGFTELLLRRHGGALPGEAAEFAQLILESARRSGELLDNLLSYARAGGAAGVRETVDPGAVVAEVLGALRAQVDARQADVQVGPLPTVAADRVQLAQVLQNLLANALKFTPASQRPSIRVTGAREEAMVRLSVADRGIGIDPEHAGGLFAMFARGAGGEDYEGTGIGLAVCARIVAAHGGRLWVDPAPGGGSVFSFTMPAG